MWTILLVILLFIILLMLAELMTMKKELIAIRKLLERKEHRK
ncbi:MAG: hypothetical protein ACI35R_03410 [Bacillus sp. (in: firmicutes)]